MSREDLNLADIPGLGPVRREALAAAGVHDLADLLRLKVAELAAIRGVGAWQARRIAEFLRQRGLALEVELPGGQPALVVNVPQSREEEALVEEAVETLSAQAALEAELEYQVEQLEEAAASDRELDETDALNDEETALMDAVSEPEASPEGTEGASRRGARKGKAAKSRVRTPKEKKATTKVPPPASEEPRVSGGWAPATEAAHAEAPAADTLPDAKEVSAPAPKPKGEGATVPAGGPDEAQNAAAEEGRTLQVQEETESEGTDDWESRIREQREKLPEAALELMEAIRAAAVSKQLTRQITRLLITAGEFITDARPISPEHRQAASEALTQAEKALRRAVERRSFNENQQKDLANRIRRRRKELEQLLEPLREPTREKE